MENNVEIWKDIKGFETYQVSNLGRVKSNRSRKTILKPNDLKGYQQVTLINNNERKSFLVHRLVAKAFIPNPNNYQEVNHKDENKANNSVSNLEWCNRTYNCNYGDRNKKIRHYQQENGSVRNREILQYDLNGNFIKEWYSIADICREFNVSQSSISKCCINKGTSIGYIWRYKEGVN